MLETEIQKQNQNQYEATIVLGGGCESNDRLSPRSIARLQKALELCQAGRVARLILSGGISLSAPRSFTHSEASLMRDYLLTTGLIEEEILLEEKSADTLGNAYFTKTIFLEPNCWRNFQVITSNFHIARCRYLFGKVFGPAYRFGFEASDAPATAKDADTSAIDRLESHIQSIYAKWLDPITDGDTDAVGRILFERHPGYAEQPDFTREEFVRMLYGDSPSDSSQQLKST